MKNLDIKNLDLRLSKILSLEVKNGNNYSIEDYDLDTWDFSLESDIDDFVDVILKEFFPLELERIEVCNSIANGESVCGYYTSGNWSYNSLRDKYISFFIIENDEIMDFTGDDFNIIDGYSSIRDLSANAMAWAIACDFDLRNYDELDFSKSGYALDDISIDRLLPICERKFSNYREKQTEEANEKSKSNLDFILEALNLNIDQLTEEAISKIEETPIYIIEEGAEEIKSYWRSVLREEKENAIKFDLWFRSLSNSEGLKFKMILEQYFESWEPCFEDFEFPEIYRISEFFTNFLDRNEDEEFRAAVWL